MDIISYGLIGKKLGHSFSARYFNNKFKDLNIPSVYSLFEIPRIEDFERLIKLSDNLRGLNVTIPYKEEVLTFLNSMTPTALAIGAVNTIRIDHFDRLRLTGHNTDAEGFRDAIRPLIGDRKRALVLGNGGASKAVKYALLELGIDYLQVSRRYASDCITYSQIDKKIMDQYDIVINCTPLGMWPDVDNSPEIPYEYITEKHLCFDLVYNPEVTKFMNLCSLNGATVSNGLQMLINQAEAAYKFWNSYSFNSEKLNDGESILSLRKIKKMSRRIDIFKKEERIATYYLSIATLFLSDSGEVMRVEVAPYEKEIAGVEYVDHPLEILLT